jgi:hypothetical protein
MVMFPEIKIPFKVLLGIALGGLLIITLAGPFLPFLNGLVAIQLHPSILITDYLAVGGLQATLANAWIVTWVAILTLHRLQVKFSGVSFAGVLTIFAFAFFGKNILNIIPIWIGFYLYTKMKGTNLSQYTGTFLFSTGLGPITSFMMFGIPGIALYISIPLGIASGMLAGWLTPMVVSVVGKFHQGYNLYNTGFGMGFIAMLFTGFLKAFNVEISVPQTVTFAYHTTLLWFVLVLSIGFMGVSFLLHRQVYRPWLKLLQSPGNLPSDFYKEFGLAATLFNVGTIGLFSLMLVIAFNFQLSGPMIAGVFTFMAFGSYGKHIQNVSPVITGLILATLIPGFSLTNFGPSIAVFFVGALAPVSGKFGIFYGMLAGFIHLLIAPQALALQGGFDLYNNGFTAGLVAGIVVVVAQQFPFPNLLQRLKRRSMKH